MDPAVYNKFTGVWTGAHAPPTSEAIQDQDSTTPKASDMNWTVSRPDITRGNFGGELHPSDPRGEVGWKESDPADVPPKVNNSSSYFRKLSWNSFFDENSVAEPRAQDGPSVYPYPNLSLPHPSLNLDFRMSVTLGDRIPVGSTATGRQNWIVFTGGSWSGSWGTGIVLPGGQDSEMILSDGSTRLEANFLIQTHETTPAFIKVKANGWTTGPPEVLASLASSDSTPVDPSNYNFRLFIEMETADERYREKVNCGMWVGSGMKKSSEIIFDAYRVS